MSPVGSKLNELFTTRATILLAFALTVKATFLNCPTGFANFGGSLTDTGNSLSLFPYFSDAEFPPYGQTFFGRPAKRFCNGRLVPDFFSLAFRKALLDPYIKATSYEYQSGVNFAEEGARAVRPEGVPLAYGVPIVQPKNPVSLFPFQLNQFKRFFNSVVTAESDSPCASFYPSLPFPFGTSWVSQWLFTIESGINDLMDRIIAGIPAPSIIFFSDIYDDVIRMTVQGIIQTIKELYGVGARKFLVFGVPVQGCSTVVLTLFPDTRFNPINGANPDLDLKRDSLGCIELVNDLVKRFNTALLSAIQTLRPTLPGANVAFFDYYAANLQILTAPAAFGFTQTFRACCGAPGLSTLNYNPATTCGRPGSNVCPNPDQYVNWDGEHFTDAFYKIISIFALNGQFTDGGINYAATCSLDFTKFTNIFTFNQVYPFVCQTIFV